MNDFSPVSQGHAEATFYLAQAYRSGGSEMGLPQDLGRFGTLVQQAAAAGSADAMFAIGGAFFHGEDGFAQDPRAAFRSARSHSKRAQWCYFFRRDCAWHAHSV